MLGSITDKLKMVAKTRRTKNLRGISADRRLLTSSEALLAIQTQADRVIHNAAKISRRLTVVFLTGFKLVRAE